jgi:phosphohistidine swiveling domain-containing protein
MKPIRADIISGFSSTIFGISLEPDVIAWSDRRNRYRFPFHGVTIDTRSRHGTEWNDRAGYRRVSFALIDSLNARVLSEISAIGRTITREADVLDQHAKTLISMLHDVGDDELVTRFDRFMRIYSRTYGLGCFTFLYEETASEHLTDLLRRHHDDVGSALDAVLATRYVSYMTESSRLLKRIRAASSKTKRDALVARFLDEFFHIDASYAAAPKLTAKTVLFRARHRAEPRKTKPSRAPSLSKNEHAVVELLRRTEPIRDQRKRVCQIGLYVMFRVLDEAIRRGRLPKALAERALWSELPDLLNPTPAFRKRLAARTVATFAYRHGKGFFRTGTWIRERKEVITSDDLTGTPSSAGIATGVVRIVHGKPDFAGFKPGEILVSEMTRPEFLPILRHARAIVTDEGGLTCHAAIVSRELGIPCVVGTRFATRTLKNGDIVEVDATKGIVRTIG